MSILNHHELLELHQAVIASKLTDSRTALLAGINSTFIAGLPTAMTPSAQALMDLAVINEISALNDDTVPLLIWLANAMTLAGPREESFIFQRALQDAEALLRYSMRRRENNRTPVSRASFPTDRIFGNSIVISSGSVVFADTRMDTTNPGWHEVTGHDNPFGQDLKKDFHQSLGACNVDPCFDVTILNRSTEPAVVTDVGIEIVAVTSRSYIAGIGIPQAAKIKRVDSYAVQVPEINALPRERAEDILSLNIPIRANVPDPIYLQPGAPYRYSLALNGYRWNMPNHAILRLWVSSTEGVHLSDNIHLHSWGQPSLRSPIDDDFGSTPMPRGHRAGSKALCKESVVLRTNQVWTGICAPAGHLIRLVVLKQVDDVFDATIEHVESGNLIALAAGYCFDIARVSSNVRNVGQARLPAPACGIVFNATPSMERKLPREFSAMMSHDLMRGVWRSRSGLGGTFELRKE